MYFLIALRPDSMYPGTGLPAAERGGGAGVRGRSTDRITMRGNHGSRWRGGHGAQPGLADM